MTSDDLTLTAHPRIHDVPAAAWDACAGADNPFVRHAFLAALEDSRSVSAETGWLPQHLALRDGAGRLVACAPLYVKSHSYGEYVFDWGWADAYQRAGGRYYPKLQCAVPFTPATGPRLMVHPAAPDPDGLRRTLVSGMMALAGRIEASSVHVTFPTAEEAAVMEDAGLLTRLGQQFHWENRGYRSFDDFLGALSSRKRKAIRKERDKANAQGIRFLTLSGEEITPRQWEAFYGFYLSTVDRKWGQAYLRRPFFDLLGERLGSAVVLVLGEAEDSGTLVCGALNLRGGDTLYGRNWGALGDYRFLHFEACYYRAIDYAIAHNLRWVEAGAQGSHKVQRGYLPRPTWSAHWIADAGFRRAVERFVEEERHLLCADMEDTEASGPYRKEDP
jgi:predicted N-acyltransferase